MEKNLIDLHLIKNIHTIEGKIKLDINLEIPEFGFITLFGKSGVGKTTISTTRWMRMNRPTRI